MACDYINWRDNLESARRLLSEAHVDYEEMARLLGPFLRCRETIPDGLHTEAQQAIESVKQRFLDDYEAVYREVKAVLQNRTLTFDQKRAAIPLEFGAVFDASPDDDNFHNLFSRLVEDRYDRARYLITTLNHHDSSDDWSRPKAELLLQHLDYVWTNDSPQAVNDDDYDKWIRTHHELVGMAVEYFAYREDEYVNGGKSYKALKTDLQTWQVRLRRELDARDKIRGFPSRLADEALVDVFKDWEELERYANAANASRYSKNNYHYGVLRKYVTTYMKRIKHEFGQVTGREDLDRYRYRAGSRLQLNGRRKLYDLHRRVTLAWLCLVPLDRRDELVAMQFEDLEKEWSLIRANPDIQYLASGERKLWRELEAAIEDYYPKISEMVSRVEDIDRELFGGNYDRRAALDDLRFISEDVMPFHNHDDHITMFIWVAWGAIKYVKTKFEEIKQANCYRREDPKRDYHPVSADGRWGDDLRNSEAWLEIQSLLKELRDSSIMQKPELPPQMQIDAVNKLAREVDDFQRGYEQTPSTFNEMWTTLREIERFLDEPYLPRKTIEKMFQEDLIGKWSFLDFVCSDERNEFEGVFEIVWTRYHQNISCDELRRMYPVLPDFVKNLSGICS